ncbi:acyl-CoA dehydrogenase family protein [Sphingopyxis sp. CCNWLW253]|uniref:acyl-CoA dehydrogenase family protein n=1 Tax=unclassified Sphingopyxis TaxID=2614943 RepID=UPI0030130EA3
MDFAKSDIQTMLLDSAERLLAEGAGVEYWRDQRHGALGFDDARWAQFAELGWLALPLPEEAGGLDGTIEDVALLNIALGRALATEPYASSVVLAGHILRETSENASAAALLGDLASGETRLAVAYQEAGFGALADEGADAVLSKAVRSGDGYRLSGDKLLVLDAPSASNVIVCAKLEDEPGFGLFLVPADGEGVAISAYPLIDGTRAADIGFSDVSLPASALLAGGNRAADILADAIDRASIALMAQAVGAMEAAIEICGAYVKERKQFGVAIGSFQAIQHMMAEMFVAGHQARSMLYHALANADADIKAALSAARIVIGEASQLVSRSGIQVHGGYGLTDEYAISHYFRRLMVLEKQYGDLNDHVDRFADSLFA